MAHIELRNRSFLLEPWEEEAWDIVWVASLCMRRAVHASNIVAFSREMIFSGFDLDSFQKNVHIDVIDGFFYCFT